MKIPFLLVAALCCCAHVTYGQWNTHRFPNIPSTQPVAVSFVCSDNTSDTTFVFTHDTSYHLYTHSPASGMAAHPEDDTVLDEIPMILDARVRNGVLWCTTPSGLKKRENGTWTSFVFPSPYQCHSSGLYIDSKGHVWFAGGKSGRGFTRFDGSSWVNIEQTAYPDFLQDMGVVDLEMDEQRQLLWIGTNCFTQQSGVYSYYLPGDRIRYIGHNNPKYGCIHAVQPSRDQVFVGTSNFSSIRILENGTYTQSLDAPKVKWVADMQVDPSDSNQVWVLNDYGVTLFKDTVNFHYYDTLETPLRGVMNRMSIQRLESDSVWLWIGTTTGLYSLRYKSPFDPVSTPEFNGVSNKTVVYPNPSTGLFEVSAPGLRLSDIKLFNVWGAAHSLNGSEQSTAIRIDMSAEPDGLYFLHITTPSYSEVKRVEVRH